MKLLRLIEKGNLAKGLKKDYLFEIGEVVCKEYKDDRLSRQTWEENLKNALKFAKQIPDPKNFPFVKASNIILPLLTTASISIASRIYPELIQKDAVANIGTFGDDPTGEKADRAERVKNHINYQLLVESDVWESDVDKMLNMLPITGTTFKKVYYDPQKKVNRAELCDPQDIVVNYHVKSLEDAPRITHRYFMTGNDIVSRVRTGVFVKVDLEELDTGHSATSSDEDWNTEGLQSDMKIREDLYEILEQHRYLDLDDDGYEEPYIVTVHRASNTVLSIYPRFDVNSIELNDAGEITYIAPETYFIDYHFLPSPDGGFYSIGFGQILYPINKSCNTILNQLIDAGTLANTKGGLISRQLKMKGGNLRFQMGELIPVEPGVNGKLQDNVMLFDFGDPSPVLFQLLGLLIESAKEVASINDVMSGQALPQNAPATSTMELTNQGLKVYGSIAKRTVRSHTKELKRWFFLNKKYMDDTVYVRFQDNEVVVAKEDYEDDSLDIIPVADPKLGSDVKKQMQFQVLSQMIQNPAILQTLNIPELMREFLKEIHIPEETIQKLVLPPQQNQAPDPTMVKAQIEMQKVQMKSQTDMMQAQLKAREIQTKSAVELEKLKLKKMESSAKIAKMQADARKDSVEASNADAKLDIERDKIRIQEQKNRLDHIQKIDKNNIDRYKR